MLNQIQGCSSSCTQQSSPCPKRPKKCVDSLIPCPQGESVASPSPSLLEQSSCTQQSSPCLKRPKKCVDSWIPCPQGESVASPSPSLLEQLVNNFPRPHEPKPCTTSPRHTSPTMSCRSPRPDSPRPSPKSFCTSPNPNPHCPRAKSPCKTIFPIIEPPCTSRSTSPCLTPTSVCPRSADPKIVSPSGSPRSKPQQTVTTTLKDIVNRIKLGMKFAQNPEDCESSPCNKDRVRQRCVRFNAACVEGRPVEELFFNADLNTIEPSESEICANECPQQRKSPCSTSREIKIECISPCNKTEESGAGSSLAGSGSGGGLCDEARAQYYHNKLLATLQILQNKEETVRVQAESLAVAEQRIDALSERAAQLKRERDSLTQEVQKLRKCADPNNAQSDVKVQKNMVTTLQNNLSVIEDLYRECFYESAKQEELIEKLRKSYLDVRLMEKEKVDQIGRLQNVVNSQRWSLERCQDIVIEVENLKLEISNFLNNSNNDSGMWEEAVAGEVGEDLHDIMQQLHQLRELLQKECTCELKEENERLKTKTQCLERQVEESRQNTLDMEKAVMERDEAMKIMRKKIDETAEEMQGVMQELSVFKKRERERLCHEECLKKQLQQTQVALEEKSAELEDLNRHSAEQDNTIIELRKELDKAEQINKEKSCVRSEVQYLSQQVSLWRRQLAASEARVRGAERDLLRARTHCRQLDTCYREKAEAAAALEAQLAEAHARGAELCAEARRVVCAVRRWVRRMNDTHSELEEKIKKQEATIASLRQALERSRCQGRGAGGAPCDMYLAQVHTRGVGCSKCARNTATSEREETISEGTDARAGPSRGASETGNCRCKRVGRAARRLYYRSASVPAGARRVKLRDDGVLQRLIAPASREAAVQSLHCAEAGVSPPPSGARLAPAPAPTTSRAPREMSPSVLCERMELLSEALTDGQRRWARAKR